MAEDHPELSKTTIVIRQDRNENVSGEEHGDLYLLHQLPQVDTIYWKLGDEQASVQFHARRFTRSVPLQQVYHAFQDQEERLRKLIALLESGEVQRLETVFQLAVQGEEEARFIRVKALMDHETEDKEQVMLIFLGDAELSEEVIYPIRLDEIPMGLLYVESQTGSILEANDKALELLAMPDEDLLNISWQRTPEWLSFIQEVQEKESVVNRVLEISAGKTWGLFAARQMEDRILVFAQDISPLQQQIQTLQKVNVGLDNFVYHASHDLRSPLRSMQGLITLLRTETNAKERDKFVELIEGSIKRLDAFLVDLLSISRSKRSQHRPLVKINFMVEVEKAVSSFYHLGDTTNLEISTRISQPVTFVSDLTQVRVILNNIISNAFKYRRYGVRKSRIKIEIRVTRKQANIKISDNGQGIAEEHLPHVFDMFYRATDRTEGSGLGLYIVRETVEKLKGSISLKSQPSRGTTFTIILPNQYQSQS